MSDHNHPSTHHNNDSSIFDNFADDDDNLRRLHTEHGDRYDDDLPRYLDDNATFIVVAILIGTAALVCAATAALIWTHH